MADVVMAVATMMSVLVALVALVFGMLGFARGGRAESDAKAARESAVGAQWKMSEHLETIAERLADAATSAAAGGAKAPIHAGRLSARLSSPSKNRHRVTIANVGTDTLRVLEVQLPNDLRVSGGGDAVGAELDPGEEHHIVVGLSMQTRFPIPVQLRWEDDSGEHEREQKLTLA